jgi:hypothetical protein
MKFQLLLFYRSLLLSTVVMFFLSFFILKNFPPFQGEICSESENIKDDIIQSILVYLVYSFFLFALFFLKIEKEKSNGNKIINILYIPIFIIPSYYLYDFFVWECRTRNFYITLIYILINALYIKYMSYEIKVKIKKVL